MPQPRWTTDEELEWLMKWRDEWGQADTAPKRNTFYAKVEEAWFDWKPLLQTMYPGKMAEDLSPEEASVYQEALKKKKRQLGAWFRRLNTSGEPVTKSVKEQIQVLLDMIKADIIKSTRTLQKLEVYQKQYPTKINKAVKEQWDLLGVTNRSERMSIRRKVIQELYDKETPEVIALVETAYRGQHDGIDDEVEETADKSKKLKTPEEHQRNIDACSYLMRKVVDICSDFSEWTIDCMMGGYVPNRDGRPAVERYSAGKTTEAGHSFNQAYSKYYDNVYVPFSEFLWKVYPEELRKAKALPEIGPKDDQRVDLRDILKIGTAAQTPASVPKPVNPGLFDDLDLSITTGTALDPNFNEDLEHFSGPEPASGNINMRESEVPEMRRPTSPSVDPASVPTTPILGPNDFEDFVLSPQNQQPISPIAQHQHSLPPPSPVISENSRHVSTISRSQPGGPTEPIEEAIRRMNTDTNIRQSRHSNIAIDPELLNLASGVQSEDDSELASSSATVHSGCTPAGPLVNLSEDPKEHSAKKPGKRPRKNTQPKIQAQNASEENVEGRRSSRKRVVATLGPKVLVKPSQPPPKKVKHSWAYVPV